MQRIITFVYPIVRTDYIKKSLETLYQQTDTEKFNVIVIDQSISGLEKDFVDKYIHQYIRVKNQGFARAANMGIIQALRWEVPYIAICNDDTEFMYKGWLEDALSEFDTDKRIIAVCPESPRVPMWGYGLNDGEKTDILPYKEKYTEEDIAYLKKGDYDAKEIQSRHNFEIPKSFPMTKRGVIDGIAMWMPIFKREGFIELGLLEEKFVWGGGEDYDFNARAYSCAWPVSRDECDESQHKRMVSTMKSWVWHWWGQSKDIKETLDPKLFEGKEPWNDLNSLWPEELNEPDKHVDPWGHYQGKDGKRHPYKRISLSKIEPL